MLVNLTRCMRYSDDLSETQLFVRRIGHFEKGRQVQVQVQVYFTTNYRSQQFTLNYQIQFRTHFQIAVLRYDPNINMKNEILISG